MKTGRIPSARKPDAFARGMALVITLSSLLLLTVLVLAFFSRAQSNRQISYSSNSILGAKSVAYSALDIITGELRAEITDSNRSTLTGSNGIWLYEPKDSTCLQPSPLGISSSNKLLVKVSANDIPIRPNGAIKGSPYFISTASLGGRAISADRWFTSSASCPKLGSQASLPTWLFLTRGNGVKTPSSVGNARNKTSNDYVIGRFAYTIYDIGQLLDANVAGYPAVASTDASSKSSCVYANITSLGLPSSNVDELLTWRNSVTGTSAAAFREWALGGLASSGTLNPAALAAARSGHLSIVNGDNAFLTRRDLLNCPTLGPSSALLTHFSRSVNAPSANPLSVTGTNAINNPDLPNVRYPASGNILHYQDDGTPETYTVQAGDFLLQRRFSLSKLSWLTHTGPTSGISDTAIQACFGLKWDNTNYKWIYVGDATTEQLTIKTLAQVASAKREPNFFELLQAGILDGSLGTFASAGGLGQGTMDKNKPYQIINIGANIIDQYDADSYPTTISFNGFQFFGIEDLPYLNKVLIKYIGQASGSTQAPPFHIYYLYELWNPHQFTALTTSTTGRPTRFRVRINDDATYQAAMMRASGETEYATDSPIPLSGVGGDPLEFDAYTIGSDCKYSYREPRLIRTGDASTLRAELNDPTLGDCNAIRLPDIPSAALLRIRFIINRLVHTVFILEYEDNNGWHPYTTFVGKEEAGGVSGIACCPALGISTSTGIQDLLPYNKSDPRTSRMNAYDSISGQPAGDTSLHASSNAYIFSNHGTPTFISSVIPTSPSTFPFYLSLLASNNSDIKDPSGYSYPYADTDSTARPADAWYGVNPYALGDSTARPILLNRPYLNVGELGYVFRDMPWKTLDFFSSKSADGALLDLFSINDEPAVVAGRVNLNSQMPSVQQCLISGVAVATGSNASSAYAEAVASSLTSYSSGSCISNIGNLPHFIFLSQPGAGVIPSKVKSEREAPVRALASTSQTRTWNLLIDVVAQTGRYTSSSSTLDDFLVEGETRYWLSIAIDRYTGKIIDQQLEDANER